MSILLIAIAGIVSGALGAMGMGGGGVLIIYLTIFAGIEQSVAQGINIIFFIPSALIASIYYFKKKLIAWKIAIPTIILGIVGAWLGTYLSTLIDGKVLGKCFGILLLIIGIQQLITKKQKNNVEK